MSAIYFHSITGAARVSGAERAYAGILCNNLLQLALGITDSSLFEAEPYRKILPPDCYVLRTTNNLEFIRNFRTYTLISGVWDKDYLIMPTTGEQQNPFYLALNTAVAMGSDPVRLLAKLHGQCELHCYVEGPNRAWLADIIDQGVKDKILRTGPKFEGLPTKKYGWQFVIDLLRSDDDSPVVCSYSVTDQFPNQYMATIYGSWSPPEIDDAAIREKYRLNKDDDVEEYKDGCISDLWYALSDEKQWEYALQGLRKANEKGTLEMKPETFAIQGYGNGLSGFDLHAAMFD